jgi:hypothetical protein
VRALALFLLAAGLVSAQGIPVDPVVRFEQETALNWQSKTVRSGGLTYEIAYSMVVRMKMWGLVRELVRDGVFSWELGSVTIQDGEGSYSVPPEVLQEISVVDADVTLGFSGVAGCASLAMTYDLGSGTAPGKGFSYNTPESPSWTRAFHDDNIYGFGFAESEPRFAGEERARACAKAVVHTDPEARVSVDVDFNLGAARRWYDRQKAKEKKEKEEEEAEEERREELLEDLARRVRPTPTPPTPPAKKDGWGSLFDEVETPAPAASPSPAPAKPKPKPKPNAAAWGSLFDEIPTTGGTRKPSGGSLASLAEEVASRSLARRKEEEKKAALARLEAAREQALRGCRAPERRSADPGDYSRCPCYWVRRNLSGVGHACDSSSEAETARRWISHGGPRKALRYVRTRLEEHRSRPEPRSASRRRDRRESEESLRSVVEKLEVRVDCDARLERFKERARKDPAYQAALRESQACRSRIGEHYEAQKAAIEAGKPVNLHFPTK